MKKRPPSDDTSPAAVSPPPMKREYIGDGTRCLAVFWLPREAAPDATTVVVSGSFNGWSLERHPLKRLKNGDFQLALELDAGQEHEFRFLIDGARWENAWNADRYVWSDHAQGENSVILT